MKYCCSFLLLLLLGISGGFAQDKVECWGRYEISLPAKVKGNPFDIELTATFSGPDTTLTVRGFYDGNDTFKIRFMPVSQGVWSYVTQSEIPVLNKVKGRIECIAPGCVDLYRISVASIAVYAVSVLSDYLDDHGVGAYGVLVCGDV